MTASPETPPRLSIVVASRNDNHGGDMLKRMRLFVRGLLDQTRRHGLRAELIVVEWNPPVDRPPLAEVLPRPGAGDLLTVRYVVVPSALHARYRRAAEIPLFQMIAKNVGIRRARADYVLCTNVDLLFSDPLVRHLATGELSPNLYYRANRCDVPDRIDPTWDITRQLAWCERNVIRRLGRVEEYRHVNVDLLGARDASRAKKWSLDKLSLGMRLFWDREKQLFYQLDTFACGDFTLMTHDAWMAIEGYLELDLYSLHIDSLGLIAATALGYAQHVLPRDACTYHIDHADGWEALSPLQKVRFLERRPAIDYSLVYDVAMEVMRKRKPLGLNAPTWGFADQALPEHVFTPPARAEKTTADPMPARELGA